MDKTKEDADPRLEFINSYVTKTFRIKSDRWQKLMLSDDKVTNCWFPLETQLFSNPFSPADNRLRLAQRPENPRAVLWNWIVWRPHGFQQLPQHIEDENLLLRPENADSFDS